MLVETIAQVGESWAGYTILETLGHLGLAERYRVRGGDGRVHLLDVVAMQHPDLVRRLQEAKLQRVVHPNLLTVHEVVAVVRFPGLVCSDTRGVALAQWRKDEPSLQDKLEVIRGIASGLAALHDAGLTHGCLQPATVIVEPGRRGPVGRLGLLGVAPVVFSILREGGAVTTSGASFGGVAFQAPEHQRDPSQANPRSDLFSLGCLLYWLLSGHSPFARLDPVSCYEASRHERYIPISEKVPGLAPELAVLVQDLLRAKPEARPSASEVAAKLERMLPARSRPRWTWWGLLVLAIGAALLGAGILL
jgi:serine/threonine protein kinase